MYDTSWVQLTNLMLALVTLVCVVLVVVVALPDAWRAYRDRRARLRLARPAGHSPQIRNAWRGVLPQQRWLW